MFRSYAVLTLALGAGLLAFAQSAPPALSSPDAGATAEPAHVRIREVNVTRSEALHLHLAPGGGCAIRFIPRKDQ